MRIIAIGSKFIRLLISFHSASFKPHKKEKPSSIRMAFLFGCNAKERALRLYISPLLGHSLSYAAKRFTSGFLAKRARSHVVDSLALFLWEFHHLFINVVGLF